nr:MAG TPA: hypothetical protein [Caudoviricetes sp.]
MGIFSEDEARDCHYAGLQAKAEKWEKTMHKGPDGFRPCPICGRRLTMNNIHFCDCEGEYIEDLETMHDFEHARDPSNIAAPEDWVHMSEADRRQAPEIYAEALSAVEAIIVTCNCGFCMMIDPWDIDFPDAGWVDGFKEKANRRMGE